MQPLEEKLATEYCFMHAVSLNVSGGQKNEYHRMSYTIPKTNKKCMTLPQAQNDLCKTNDSFFSRKLAL